MSRIGVVLCALYAVVIAACFAFAYSAGGDFNGQFVFLQLPIALQGALLHEFGLGSFLGSLSLVVAYTVLGLPTFALLYLVGWLMDGRR